MAARIARREVVDLSALDDASRRDLAHALYPVHAQINSRIDEQGFHHYALSPPARRNIAGLCRDATGQMVRDDGWVTKEPAPAAQRFADLPDVACFMWRNPGYVRGHGMLVPLGVYDISVALLRRLAKILRGRK